MKRNKTNPAAREYFHAFYEKNHVRYGAAMVLNVLSIGTNLFVTWLLGAMIDIIAAGDMERLWGTLWLWLGFAAVVLAVDTGAYWAKFGFIRRALVQYKALAFRRLSAMATGSSPSATARTASSGLYQIIIPRAPAPTKA